MSLTVADAAKRLNLSVDSIKRRIYKGEIKAEKVNRVWIIDPIYFESHFSQISKPVSIENCVFGDRVFNGKFHYNGDESVYTIDSTSTLKPSSISEVIQTIIPLPSHRWYPIFDEVTSDDTDSLPDINQLVLLSNGSRVIPGYLDQENEFRYYCLDNIDEDFIPIEWMYLPEPSKLEEK